MGRINRSISYANQAVGLNPKANFAENLNAITEHEEEEEKL